MSDLPPLPKLTGDIILDVFTHKSLRVDATPTNDLCGDNDRLAELGEKVLNLTTTDVLFNQNPILSAGEISKIREEHLSDTKMDNWVENYGLRTKLRCAPNERDSIKSPEETRRLFHSYIGAVYVQSGVLPVQEWIGQVIDPNYKQSLPSQSPHYTQPDAHSNPHTSSSPPPPPSAMPPPLPNQPQYLPLVNQTAAQRSCAITYSAQSTGPAHQPTWMVKCIINGTEKGEGRGKSQRIAKEEAAKNAFYAMGWGGYSYSSHC